MAAKKSVDVSIADDAQPGEEVKQVDVDHVAMVSLRADGTPDQTPEHVELAEQPERETGAIDHVEMVSIDAAGQPNQTADHVVISE
jgi:hypothetical protein